MLRYSFWYGRWNDEDIQSLESAVAALRKCEWDVDEYGSKKEKKRRPVYIDGANFGSRPACEEAAVRLLQALAAVSSWAETSKGQLPAPASAKTLIFRNANCLPATIAALRDVLAAQNGDSELLLECIRLSNLREQSNNENNNRQPLLVPFPPSMANNTILTELSISKCRLDAAGCQALRSSLVRTNNEGSNNNRLQCLTLQAVSFATSTNNDADDDNERMSMITELLDAVAYNTSLTEFYLEAMHLNGAHAAVIARTISKNRNLSKLSLRRNLLDSDSIRVLCEDGVRYNHGSLRTLYLSHNPVGDAGARHLVALLEQQRQQPNSFSCQLNALCLVESQIGSAGCMAIASGMTTFSKHLRRLSLDGNDIHCPKVAGAFLKSLKHNNLWMEQLVECPQNLVRETEDRRSANGIWKQIDLYLRWNKAKRAALSREPQPPAAVLSEILHKTSDEPDVLYQFLRALPGLTTASHTFCCADGDDHNNNNTSFSQAKWKDTQLSVAATAVAVPENTPNLFIPPAVVAPPFPRRRGPTHRTPPCA